MRALERLPAWATTGVGSLPHDQPEPAVAHVAAAYDLPFCPWLPRLDRDLVGGWHGADPNRCGWSPERDRERPRAWEALLAELNRDPPPHRLVKLQVTGPATLACALEREAGEAPSRRETVTFAGELATWLAANMAEQIRTLAARGLDAILVVDEPAPELFGTGGVEAVWEPLRAVAPVWGLHLCGRLPWALVERAEPDLVSFDLAREGITDRAAAALRRLLARGGRVAWGLLAVHRHQQQPSVTGRLAAAIARIDPGGEQSLLTASCGTGRLGVRREIELARGLRETARLLRARPRVALGSLSDLA